MKEVPDEVALLFVFVVRVAAGGESVSRPHGRMLEVALAAALVLGCENKQEKCATLAKPLSYEAMGGPKLAAGDDEQKLLALWTSVARDASTAKEACVAAKDGRQVLVLDALLKEADTQLAELKLQPTAKAWREASCGNDEVVNTVYGEATAKCCKGTAVEWHDAKCAELGQTLEKAKAKGKALCERLSGGSCELHFYSDANGDVVHTSEKWEVAYSRAGTAKAYCQRLVQQARVEEMSPAMLAAVAASDPKALLAVEQMPKLWNRSDDHWCVTTSLKEGEVTANQTAAVQSAMSAP